MTARLPARRARKEQQPETPGREEVSASPNLVRALTSGVQTIAGEGDVFIQEGALYDESHPVVRNTPAFFAEPGLADAEYLRLKRERGLRSR
jgi:hypothetical protein